jgi:drug/metabolite transporter (DMT)-like permease
MSKLRVSETTARVVVAFLTVYLIWGSTYLAIFFAIKTMPPFLMAAVRFLVAGIVLYLLMRLRGAPRPSRIHWRSALIVGALLLVFGNGMVVRAEEVLPSSIAALLVAMVPVWMALLDWLRPGGRRPRALVLVGLALGFAGVGLLVFQGDGTKGAISLGAAALVLLASLSWAAGSLYAREAKMPEVPLVGTALEMICGGALLFVIAALVGELGQVHLQAISLKSGLSLLYLIVFGSLVAFSAYVWLLRHVAPARVSTYAYVNPVVAVFLGWRLASDPITGQTLIAAAVIVGAVALVMAANTSRGSSKTSEPSESERLEAAPGALATEAEPERIGGRA